jgi:Protein of unknown function (Gmx_para_CXXCG)
MKFWRLDSPDYSSDYAHTFINGELEHPFALPGVRCEACGATWGGGRILPYALPEELQSRKELRDSWPIEGAAHQRLRAEVLAALRRQGADIEALEPGDRFQPGFLDVPSRPEADFLWSNIGSVVVSERIRAALTAEGVRGAAFVRATLRKIGKRRAKLPAPTPTSGEPEDLITEIRATVRATELPPFYELVVTAESHRPPGTEESKRCKLCGRESYDNNARRLVMLPEMWQGDDIFFLATTRWIVVTDRVQNLLRDLRATNVHYRPLAGAA